MYVIVIRDYFISSIALFCIFFLPGLLLLRLTKAAVSRHESLVLAPAVGMIAMTFAAYILAWIQLRILFYPIVIGCLVYSLIIRKKLFAPFEDKPYINTTSLALLFIMGTIFLIPMISSGNFGTFISLIDNHLQDSPLHVALINEILKQFPPMDPGFAGNQLQNYHFFYNLSASVIAGTAHISSETVHFRTMPLLFAYLWPFLTFIVAKRLFKRTKSALLSVFFVMFGTSFSFFISRFYHVQISYNSGMGILQPPNSLLNPPYASSVIVLLTSIYILHLFDRTKNTRLLFVLPVCFGTLIEYKVYAGMIGLAGFGTYTAGRLRQYGWKIALSGLCAVFIAVGVYWPFTGKGGFLFYAPLWVTREITRASLPFMNYDNAIYVYSALFDPFRTALFEAKLLVFFIFGNFGFRVLGLVGFIILFIRKKYRSVISAVLCIMFLVSFFIPLLFMQSLKPYEISQMFNYSLLLLSFPTAFCLTYVTDWLPKFWTWGIISLILLSSAPELVLTDYREYVRYPKTTISGQKLALYRTIRLSKKQKGDALIIMPPLREQREQLGSWFWNQTNMQAPAFTDTASFLSFTNLIYSEDDVQQRASALDDIRSANVLLDTQETAISDRQHTAEKIRSILNQYAVRYIVSPYELNGLEQEKIIARKTSTDFEYLYEVIR